MLINMLNKGERELLLDARRSIAVQYYNVHYKLAFALLFLVLPFLSMIK